MNDKDFDKLIAESFERDRMLESINRSVMKEINRTERKTLLHCVLKLVGMAFGIPLVGISGVSAIISGMEKAGSDIVLAALVLSLIVFRAFGFNDAYEIFFRKFCNNFQGGMS